MVPTTVCMRLRERAEFMFVLWLYNVVCQGLDKLRVHKSASIDRIIMGGVTILESGLVRENKSRRRAG